MTELIPLGGKTISLKGLAEIVPAVVTQFLLNIYIKHIFYILKTFYFKKTKLKIIECT